MIKLILSLLLTLPLLAEEKPMQELIVESSSQITLDGTVLEYRTVAGTLILKDEQGKDKASIFYTAYFLKGNTPSKDRPITYCFNGGPGSGSVWLNIGLLGPKRIGGEDITFLSPPYFLIDNESTLLDVTDLVFIDPVSTGVSREAPGIDLKSLQSVDEDINMMTDFIRLFTLKYKRWDSPKFICGESYGGMRACKVGYKLHDDHALYLNGLILIAPALDMQTLTLEEGNDLPYLLYLPTFTAIAQYHKKGKAAWKDAEVFVIDKYTKTLFLGDKLPEEEKKKVANSLSDFTGLSEEFILRSNLRIGPSRFMKELMQKEGNVVGRFDGRILGIDHKGNEFYSEYDASLEAVFGAVTATYNQYLAKDLKWPELREYRALLSISPWNWGKANHYASALPELKRLMGQNPKLKVFAAGGLYDLAVPFCALDYSLSHLNLPKAAQGRIHQKIYPAGHMMYFNQEIRKQLRQEILNLFFQN